MSFRLICNLFYFRGLFKTPSWKPGVYSKLGVYSSKYGTSSQFVTKILNRNFEDSSFRPKYIWEDTMKSIYKPLDISSDKISSNLFLCHYLLDLHRLSA